MDLGQLLLWDCDAIDHIVQSVHFLGRLLLDRAEAFLDIMLLDYLTHVLDVVELRLLDQEILLNVRLVLLNELVLAAQPLLLGFDILEGVMKFAARAGIYLVNS